MNGKVIKVAASTFVLGVTMVGCKPAASSFRPEAISSRAPKSDQQGFKAYQQAAAAMKKGSVSDALAAMEQAVQFSPQDAGYRMGLADLYMKSGRFASAETTFSDVLALNPSDTHAGFKRAIAQLAQGKVAEALSELDRADQNIAPADLGLAYALVGESSRALQLLVPAATAPTANGRVRQNLALAYALAGDWKRARALATQDVSPSELNKRLSQWAALASPQPTPSRVVALLGIDPVTDPGQPIRLALAPAVPASPEQPHTALAAADPAPALPPQNLAPPIQAAAEPVIAAAQVVAAPTPPIAAPAADAPVATQVFATAATAPAEPAVDTVTQAKFVKAAEVLLASPSAAPARKLASVLPAHLLRSAKKSSFGASNFVVQIGAYSSPAQVERAWAQAQRQFAFGATAEPVSTTVTLPGRGVFHRLGIGGFSSPSPAAQLCNSIRAHKGACFVRKTAGDAPLQWAMSNARKNRA